MVTNPPTTADWNALAVGLGEYKISAQPQDVLVAYGLGSCVGVIMYDPQTLVGGLLHAVLPQNTGSDQKNPAHYVESGVPLLLNELIQAGANRYRLKVWLTGGANMLGNSPGLARVLNIGERNAAMALTSLAGLRLPAPIQEIGGTTGRTVRLYIGTGKATLRMMGRPEREF